jgi:hypothetical protein
VHKTLELLMPLNVSRMGATGMSASVRVTLEDESYTTNDVPETTAQN